MTIGRNPGASFLSASEYILDNFEPSDRIAMLVLNRDLGEVLQRVATAKKASSPEFQAWLRHKNATGSDIYIGMNPLRKRAATRTKQDIKSIRHVYLDLDHGGQEALNSIENSSAVPKPNYVLTSSPGKFQIVWKVEGMGLREAEGLLRAMARECGGDPAATDATRVLRLPGFANKKYETNFFVEVRKLSEPIYRFRDFRLSIDSQSSPSYNDHERAKRASSPRAKLSQSEHDWAFAKRALARGEPLDEVIRRIAQYRAAFKSNPLYYARHTVMKVAKLFRQSSSTENKEVGRRGSKEELPSEH
ncbi:MAG TPA: DNA-primase RepB domain-containing protein [Candidatus Eremiobacteraceae bacterium]|nr:DNA-primase RepB domain-containing protein [Candidatus Eremiobacteraceae bacterium]